MDNKIDKILEKIDKLSDDMSDMKVTMAVNTTTLEANTATLEVHVKRTDLAEESINKLSNKLVEELKPVKAHIAFIKGVMWALGITGSILFGLQQMGLLSKLF